MVSDKKLNMKIRFEDVLDLEHLIQADEDPDSREQALKLAERDREIYARFRDLGPDEKELLFAWLVSRKEQYTDFLPGKTFSLSVSIVRYLAVFAGALSGIIAAWSFLSYRGTQPVNVAMYLFLFIALPLIFSFAALLFRFGKKNSSPVLHTLISGLSFRLLPKFFRRLHIISLNKLADSAGHVKNHFQLDQKEYREIYFWLFFTLTSLFSFSFACGTLSATFFKVLISDIAFGWQSTLISAGQTVHDLVSSMAVPWKWFFPEGLAVPDLSQVEGSRIILKDGIEVLATSDLVSWWPFICMAILTYAVIPRLLCILAAKMIVRRKLSRLNFDHPRFSQVIVRMQSPVLEIDDQEEKKEQTEPLQQKTRPAEVQLSKKPDPIKTRKAALLANQSVFDDRAIDSVVQYVKQYLFLDTVQAHAVTFDAQADKEKVSHIIQSDIDQVVLLQEAWQPPIRGLLFYLKQIREQLPETVVLCVFLTGSAAQEDLCVSKDDMDAAIWENAVSGLKHPGIILKRMLSS